MARMRALSPLAPGSRARRRRAVASDRGDGRARRSARRTRRRRRSSRPRKPESSSPKRARIRFAHPLLASAVYAATSHERRRQLHRHLAGVVSDPEERARHLAESATQADVSTAAEIEHAAERAARRGAQDAAAQLYGAAARLTPDDRRDDAARRMLGEAAALFAAGDPRRRTSSGRDGARARRGGDASRRGERPAERHRLGREPRTGYRSTTSSAPSPWPATIVASAAGSTRSSAKPRCSTSNGARACGGGGSAARRGRGPGAARSGADRQDLLRSTGGAAGTAQRLGASLARWKSALARTSSGVACR